MNNLMLAADTAGYTMPQTWRILSKAGYFIGLSGAIGATVGYAAAVRPALGSAERNGAGPDAAVLRSRSAAHVAWAGVVLLVTGYLVQNIVLLAAAAVMIALFVPAVRRHTDRVVLAALPAALAVTLVAAVPPIAPTAFDRWLDLVLDQVHIVSGAVWLGGLALLVALAGTRRGLGDGAGLLWAQLWQRFGLVAMVCVGAITVSGLWLSWKHVGSVPQLWTTGYGIALLVKVLLVAGLVTAGAFNQFWLMPRITRARLADDTATLRDLTLGHFPKVVWGEVALGLAVLLVLPFGAGSARTEAGSPKAVFSGSILAAGAALVVALAVSLYATGKVSDLLARRPLPAVAV